MADQVYDPENQDKKPVEQKEEVAPSHEREIAQPGGFKGLRQSYGDFRKKQKADNDAAQKRNEGLRNYWQQAKDDDEADDRGFFKSGKDKSASGLSGIFKKKRLIAVIAGAGIIGVLFAFSGLLSTFKMDHLMSNIDEKAFARMNGSLDVRNINYIRTYMELRLADICTSASDTCPELSDVDRDNLIFKSDTVQRSQNPIFNWYRTMRASNFEADVFQKNGIIITSGAYRDQGQIKFRIAKITINGDVVSMPDEVQSLLQGAATGNDANWAKLTNYVNSGELDSFFNVQFFESNSARRAVIKDVVNSNTQWFNVFKRRQLRKDISNKTGVSQWRFFDDTRTQIDAKKIQIRNKLIDAITPSDTTSGKFIDCLFGISDCKFSPDPGNPVNDSNGVGDLNPNDDIKSADGKPDVNGKIDYTVDYTSAADAIKSTFSLAGGVVTAGNFATILNSLATVDKTITSGTIEAQVVMARSIQAIALYQTFETIRDQMKTGNVNSNEVNQFMQNIANFTASEAWIKVVEGKGDPKTLAVAGGTAAAVNYCSANHQATDNEFAYLCNNTIIGDTSGTGIATLQNAYNSGPGKILHPILSNYKKAFGWFGDAFNWVFKETLGPVVNQVFNAITAIFPGVKESIQNAVGWASGKTAILLGAGPMYNHPDNTLVASGQLGNGVIEGAAATSELAQREAGASITTAATKATAQVNYAAYEQEQSSSQSFIAKYFSPNNQQSLLSNALFATSQLKFSSIGHIFTNLGSMFQTIASALSLPFTHHALAAAADSGYEAADVAQIQTYDFPSQCLDADPLSMTPQNSTNVQRVFPNEVKDSDLTWDLETNSTAWYTFLYKLGGSNDPMPGAASGITKAMDVYNCALLDNSVRGDIGYEYGYTQDNGYNGTGDSSGSTTSASGNTQQLAQQILSENQTGKIQFSGTDVQQDIEDAANGQPGSAGVATSSAILQLIATVGQSHTAVVTSIQDGGNGHCLNAAGQAQPKSVCPTDPHYNGDAVDFGSFDGHKLQGRDTYSVQLIDLAETVLPTGSAFGQSQCGSVTLQPGFSQIDDSCTHLHIQVPAGTP